jgi:hypothetical protein
MTPTPDNESPSAPQGEANSTGSAPSPSEAIAIFLDWLKHYWDTPREKSKWTEVATVVLTLLIAVAAFWSAWIFNRQLEVMGKQFEATDRPWIALDVSPNSPLTYDSIGLHAEFTIVPKNVGRSPAQNIFIQAGLIAGLNYTEWKEGQKKMCDWAASKERVGAVPGQIVFPEKSFTQETFLQLSNAEIDSFWATLPPIALHTEVPVGLIGCAAYFGASGIPRQTGFMFGLVKHDRHFIDITKTPIPRESLILIKPPGGSDFAN